MKDLRIQRRGFSMLMLIFFISIFSAPAFAQEEIAMPDNNLKYMDLGIKQMEREDYRSADKSFKIVLESVKVLPPDICYYFGVNSYHLKKFKQSINWLNKYIELKGTTGQFFESCTEYLKLAEDGYRNKPVVTGGDQNKEPDVEIEDFSGLPTIDCGPTGKVLCPVCSGQTVIIRKGPIGDEYLTCPYCDVHGKLTCEEYNLLIKGELAQKR